MLILLHEFLRFLDKGHETHAIDFKISRNRQLLGANPANRDIWFDSQLKTNKNSINNNSWNDQTTLADKKKVM